MMFLRITLLLLAVMPLTVLGAPTTVQVCVQVEDDLDVNLAEGGTWDYTVGDQIGDITGGLNEAVSRLENESANPATCGTAFSFTPASAGLSVFQQVPAFEWVANAAGNPEWEIVDAANPGSVFQTGAGQNATLNATEFSAIPDGTDIAVIYTNREARRISFCKLVEDNGDATPNQGQDWTFRAADVPGIPEVTINANESSGTVCDPTFIELPFADPTQRFFEPLAGVTMAPGYPIFSYTDSKGNPAVVPLVTGVTGGVARTTVDLSALEDDVLLTVTNRYDVPRTWQICKILEDNGDAVDNGGDFHIGIYPFIQNVGGTRVVNVPEDGTEVCGAPRNIPSTWVEFVAAETAYFAEWDGNAIGYPRWELRNADTDAVLASGTGDTFEWNLVNDTVNGAPPPVSLLGLANMKIVFINREGDFGNGADPTTGDVIKPCKLVEDNGDAVLDEGTFNLALRLHGVSPVNGQNILAFPFYQTIAHVVNAAEGDGVVCAEGAYGLPPWTVPQFTEPNSHMSESFAGNWRGNTVNYPRLRYEDSSGQPLPNPGSPYDEFMPNSRIPSPVDLAAIGVVPGGDYRAVVVNRAAPPATFQMCIEMLDNGLPPVTDVMGVRARGPVFSPLFPRDNSYPDFSEGDAAICDTPRPLSGWPTSNVARFTWVFPAAQQLTNDLGFPRIDWELYEPGTTNLVASGTEVATASATLIDMNHMGPVGTLGLSLDDIWDGPIANCEPFNGCDVRMTLRLMEATPVEVCKQVLHNGDMVDDSETFPLTVHVNLPGNPSSFNVSNYNANATEGGSPVCFDYTQTNRVTANEHEFSEQFPSAIWSNGQTPGFPMWQYTDTIRDTTPVEGTGNNFVVERGCTLNNPFGPGGATPDPTICPYVRGPVTATFYNRLGPVQTIQFCKEVTGNGDGAFNQGGLFTINGRHDDGASPQFGDKLLTANEIGDADSGLVCGTAETLPPLATTFGGSETGEPAISFPDWPGNSNGFPQWRVVDGSGMIASGSGNDTGDIAVVSTTGNVQVIFTNSPVGVGQMTVNKTVVGQAPVTDWTFRVTSATAGCPAGPISQTITNTGGSTTFLLPVASTTDGSACDYTVQEMTQAGWQLTDLTSSVGTVDIPGAQVTGVTLVPGNPVTVDFENTAQVDVSLIKNLTSSGPYITGSTVTFDLVIANAGPNDATNVVVTDTFTNLSFVSLSGGTCAPASFPCTIPSLPVGNSETLTVTATITANANFDNEATALPMEVDVDLSNNTDNTGNGGGTSQLVVTKTATLTTDNGAPGLADVNDVITFSVTVQNTGSQTLDTLVVTDPMGGGALSCTPTTLAPTETAICTSYTYTVMQGDIDIGGTIDNTATATAEDPDDNVVTDDDSTSTPIAAQGPALIVDKTATLTTDNGSVGLADVNDVITFAVSVLNNGNVTLDNLVVTDPMGGGTLTCTPTTLLPGDTASCTAYTYTVMQSDVDAGGTIDNTASATAEDPGNNPVTDDDSTSTPVVGGNPAITTTKTATLTTDNGAAGLADVGDVITFAVTVQNTGNVTLTNLVVTDPMGGGTLSCTPTTLLPSETATCTSYTYTVMQSDIDAGGTINNTASATAEDPGSNPVTDDDSTATPVAAGGAALLVTKTATLTTDNGTAGVADVDDVITYAVMVQNTGNVTLTNLVVTDPMGGGTLSCTPTTLQPAEVATCTSYTYTVMQSDIDAGGTIDNTATATADDPGSNPVTDDDSTSTAVGQGNPPLQIRPVPGLSNLAVFILMMILVFFGYQQIYTYKRK